MSEKRLKLVTAFTCLLVIATLAAGYRPASAAPSFQLPWPTNYQQDISGYVYGCGTHTGIDFFAIDFGLSYPDPVTAAARGQVTNIIISGTSYGNRVVVNHGGDFTTLYGHLTSFASGLSVGSYVRAGQTLGFAGDTGNASGEHLHLRPVKDGAAYQLEPMSGLTGFGQYGQSSPAYGGSCSTYTQSPFWSGNPSKGDAGAFRAYSSSNLRISSWTSSGTSFGSPGTWSNLSGYYLSEVDGRVVKGDFNGDHREDVAAFYDYGSGASRIHVWTSTGTGLSYSGSSGWFNSSSYSLNAVGDNMVAGDFNNDGYDDVAMFFQLQDDSAHIHVFRSTGSGFTSSGYVWYQSSGAYTTIDSGGLGVSGRMVAGDFNGDFRDDIGVFYNYGNNHPRIHVFQSTGSNFVFDSGSSGPYWWTPGPSGSYSIANIDTRMVAEDFDGDGRQDVATMYQYSPGAQVHVFKSNGNGFSFASWWSTSSSFTLSAFAGRMAAADLDGSGRYDVAALQAVGGGGSNAKIFTWTANSSGTAFDYGGDNGWWSGSYNALQVGDRFVAPDFNDK